jgi:cell division protein FtsW
MARKLKIDRWLFLATLALVCASLVMVYSALGTKAVSENTLQKQAMWAALGVAVMALAMRFDYRHYKQWPLICTLLGACVVGLVLVLFGHPVNGSRRWLLIGSLGVQPSEFAKFATILFSAALLEQRMARINDVKYSLVPIGAVVGLVFALVYKEPDAGTSFAIVATAGVMVFAAGLAWRYVAAVGLAILPLGAVALIMDPYRVERLTAFLNPAKDPLGTGYQPLQSQLAVGTGGIFGLGIGKGVQKLGYLPYAHNDFIYAVIGEELGLIGTTAILACFAVLAWRGLRTASRAPDAHAALLATGLTAMIAVQAFVNMAVVIGLMPTKGIPLPLVSAGGSSLLVSMLAVGVLLNISQHASAEE